jgi:hypothetical protein
MCMLGRLLFVLFLLAIVLSVFLLFTDFDYPFGIFKLFLKVVISIHNPLPNYNNMTLNIFHWNELDYTSEYRTLLYLLVSLQGF